jgi:hypothetical protein
LAALDANLLLDLQTVRLGSGGSSGAPLWRVPLLPSISASDDIAELFSWLFLCTFIEVPFRFVFERFSDFASCAEK